MAGIVLGLVLALILLPLGGGMLAAVDSVVSKRRSPELASSRVAIQVFGSCLLVIGILPWVAVFVAVTIWLIEGEPIVNDPAELLIALNPMLFISTVPLAGAMLIAIGWLIGQSRSLEQEARLDKLLGSVAVIGWVWSSLAILMFALPIGLVPSAVIAIVAFVISQRRSARQSELLWILTIAAQRKMPLAPGVEAFANQCGGGYGRSALKLAELLKAGLALPDALDRVPRIFPESVNAAVRVGWESGSLAQALREVVLRRTSQKPVWHAVAGRLVYLFALLMVAQAVIGFVLYFIIPKFKKIFMDFGVELPQATMLVLQVSDWIVDYFHLVFPPLLNGVVYLMIVKCWVAWRPRFANQLLFRTDSARILRALAWSVDAGRPLTAGFDTLARCFPRWGVRHRITSALASISRGASWPQSLADQGLIRPTEATVLASAERAGNLSWAMRELAENAERRLGYRLQIYSQILFPFAVLCLGGLVFFFVAGMFSPLVKLISELSG